MQLKTVFLVNNATPDGAEDATPTFAIHLSRDNLHQLFVISTPSVETTEQAVAFLDNHLKTNNSHWLVVGPTNLGCNLAYVEQIWHRGDLVSLPSWSKA